MKIGFLGLGKMGTAIVRHLVAAGHQVTVWNRSRNKADALASVGIHVAATPAEASEGAEIVVTMVFDDAAVEEVLFKDGLLDALKPGMLHVSMSTISVALSERLTAEHAKRKVGFLAAPVFGRPSVAEAGRLWIVAAGSDQAIERAQPLFAPISRGVSVVGSEPCKAHAVKLGGNFLISAMINALSESFVYAAGQDIVPSTFFETINNALFQSPFYSLYAKVMLDPPDRPGATVELGAKDIRLLREAAESRGTHLVLARQLAEVFDEAKQAGMSNEDWAVGQYRIAELRAGQVAEAK
jgi:3-hydroxyisobutyrate dehydrogenase-like beta-hydroxyacid dehydrogenase